MVFNLGETIVSDIRTYADACLTSLIDPDTILISIFEPDGDAIVSDAPPVKDGVGIYHYDYVPQVVGTFLVVWTMTRGTRIVIAEGRFVVN